MSKVNSENGVILYTKQGKPVRIALMDEDDQRLNLCEVLQQGVYGYENRKSSITVMLESP